ncbi:uncharacterized protein LOC126882225 [Diabrotica virgifera virgifera]|uniref:Uncharacterized protein n=1 Tax=Diabrotica virgifera virgifera TaxID=50390 RepID=A0ABM5JYH5_DIAVI|nr:uncharacterized protein LOC126882225 [Diabrotica virgifera virgifera]
MVAKFLFVFILIGLWNSEIEGMGKYKYIMQNMGSCNGPEYADVESPLRNLVFKKVNRTAKTLSFDVIWKRPLDDKLGATIKAEKLTNGGGGHMAIPFIPLLVDPCTTFLKNFRHHWIDFATNMGVLEPDKCPIPAGNYSLKNYVFNSEYTQPNSMPIEGTMLYRTIFQDIKTKGIFFCIEAVIYHSKI